MKKALVGVDGSKSAREALAWTSRLAGPFDAEIVAVNAFLPPWMDMPSADLDRSKADRSDVLEEWLQPLRDRHHAVRALVVEGDPRDVLLSAVEREDPDLIVVGRTGEGGGPGFLHLGSVVEQLAHQLNRPFAVIPGTSRELERILVSLDGSVGAGSAARWAGQIAQKTGANVTALAVKEPFMEWTPASSPKNWRRTAERDLQRQWAEAAPDNVAVIPRAVPNLHPADAILKEAAEHDADLVVMGTRGIGGVLGMRAGGVAMKVLHAVDRPLLLVPPEDQP